MYEIDRCFKETLARYLELILVKYFTDARIGKCLIDAFRRSKGHIIRHYVLKTDSKLEYTVLSIKEVLRNFLYLSRQNLLIYRQSFSPYIFLIDIRIELGRYVHKAICIAARLWRMYLVLIQMGKMHHTQYRRVFTFIDHFRCPVQELFKYIPKHLKCQLLVMLVLVIEVPIRKSLPFVENNILVFSYYSDYLVPISHLYRCVHFNHLAHSMTEFYSHLLPFGKIFHIFSKFRRFV